VSPIETRSKVKVFLLILLAIAVTYFLGFGIRFTTSVEDLALAAVMFTGVALVAILMLKKGGAEL